MQIEIVKTEVHVGTCSGITQPERNIGNCSGVTQPFVGTCSGVTQPDNWDNLSEKAPLVGF